MILGYPLFLGNTHFSTIFQEILMTAMKLRGQRWLWRGGASGLLKFYAKKRLF